MFYGLSNFVKKIMPKRLFYRSLIIVATPIILLQIIITVVFFDSLWIKANKGMTRSLVSEIRTLYDIYKNPDVVKVYWHIGCIPSSSSVQMPFGFNI